MTDLQILILDLAKYGLRATELKQTILQAAPNLEEGKYLGALLELQQEDRLVGEELNGEWHYKTIDKNSPDYQPLEYSPEFAEKIIAASCGEFTEIDVDAYIELLMVMAAKAEKGQ